jgi:hypothetical protein
MKAKMNKKSILGLLLLPQSIAGVGGSGQSTITLQSMLSVGEIGVTGSQQGTGKMIFGKLYSIDHRRSI